MGFLDKIDKMVDVATKAVDLGNKINASDLLSGINLNNANVNNMTSIQSTIESVINNKVNELTSGVLDSIDTSQIESMANSIDLSDFDIDLSGIEGINFM